MTRESLARISAWFIALYAFDALKPIVDIFRLPVPRSLASITLSTLFIAMALGILIHLARRQRIHILGSAEVALIALLFFWSGLEVIGASGRGVTNFDQILEFIPILLALMASRLHVKLFGDVSILVSAMAILASLLVLANTILLLSVSIGIQSSIIDTGEVMGRNGMAVIVPVCIWLLSWFPLKHWPVFHRRYNLLILLALGNALLSSARMALLILTWCVLMGAILHWSLIRRLSRVLLIPACVALIALVSYSYPVVQALIGYGIWGHGDDLTSVLSRSHNNALLLDKLAQDPLLGIGGAEVVAIKSLGYMGHTLYVNVLAAYGVIGTFAAICVLTFGLLRAQGTNREAAAHLLFLAILIFSFSNNVFGYFGVIIALIGAGKVSNTYEKT